MVVVVVDGLTPQHQPKLLLEAGKDFIRENCFITDSLHLHRLKHHFLFQGEKMSRVHIINVLPLMIYAAFMFSIRVLNKKKRANSLNIMNHRE